MAIKLEKLELLTKAQIEALTHAELISLATLWRDRIEKYQGILFRFKNKLFGKSSEKSNSNSTTSEDSGPEGDSPKPKKTRTDTTKKLSERYPDAPTKVDEIGFTEPPCCPACGDAMQDSGMREECEYLTTEPKEFIIVKQVRQKSRCGSCHSAIVTAPVPARIIPGGSYSDDMIVDASLSKYCDLIPMERYCQMAARSGLIGLPPHSLIAASMKLSSLLNPTYLKIRQETLNTKVLLADETPHRMLEGDAKTRWFLWGFSSQTACFFECHDTRSGDVSTAVLSESICEFLVTDVYSGYAKTIRIVNENRTEKNLPIIYAANCNAHARRKFKDRDSNEVSDDAQSMIDQYEEIYRLNKEAKNQAAEVILEKRSQMKPLFDAMKQEAKQKIENYSSKSQMYTAYNYFIENYEGLTRFLDNHLVPIDNNLSERILRSHVVGRKTWYGTHSRRAAETAAVHFSIVESCKLIGLNPREFYADAVRRVHKKDPPVTPQEYKLSRDTQTG